jgi:hypothetical protein
MKRIIYSNYDNKVSVIAPSPNFGGSMDDLIKSIRSVNPDFENIEFFIVDEADIPSDRTFRDAWRINAGSIDHDIETAKTIWRNKWREARAKLLEKLDIDMLRAIGSNDGAKIAEIEAKKQALRDVTQIALPDDIDEIKAVWPEILTI